MHDMRSRTAGRGMACTVGGDPRARQHPPLPARLPLPIPASSQLAEARRTLWEVTHELIGLHRQHEAASGATPDSAAALGQGGTGVDPGSFLALLTRTVNRQAKGAGNSSGGGAGGGGIAAAGGKSGVPPLDDFWISAQAAVFMLAGRPVRQDIVVQSATCQIGMRSQCPRGC